MLGLAAKMKRELAELACKHGVADPIPVVIPATSPPMGDLIVEGLATSRERPLDRIAIRPWAIPILPWQRDNPPVKLLYKHDVDQSAGVIERLEHDDFGRLRIRARVSHPFAKSCGAFSISTRVHRYELRDAETPNFYALVFEGELDEISLTDVPADPCALVLQRSTPSAPDALGESFAKALAHVDRLRAMVAALSPHLILAAAPTHAPVTSSFRPMTQQDRVRLAAIHERQARRYHAPTASTSFSTMVAALNSRMEA
jgi:hypothetical protein